MVGVHRQRRTMQPCFVGSRRPPTSLALLCVAFSALLYLGPPAVEGAEEDYTPGPLIRRYHEYTFDSSLAYAEKVVRRAIPVVAVGVFIFLVFAFWSCGRCCCKCCRPCKFSHPTKVFIMATMVLAAVGCAIIIFVGFASEKKQTDAFKKIPDQVDVVASWLTETDALLDAVLAETANVTVYITNLDNADTSNTYAADITSISGAISAMNVSVGNVGTTTGKFDFGDIKKTVETNLDEYNDLRHKIMLGILIALIVLVVCQVVVALADSFATEASQPSTKCPCIPGLLTFIFVIVCLLVWIIAGATLIFATATSDFCIDPTTNVLNMMGSTATTEAEYYLRCNEDGNTLVNPVNGYVCVVLRLLESELEKRPGAMQMGGGGRYQETKQRTVWYGSR